MAQTNIPLVEGMKLRIIKGDAPDAKIADYHLYINWIAGRVPIGAVGIVGKSAPAFYTGYQQWTIDFPDHPMEADKVERKFLRVLVGPNVSDCYEVVQREVLD